MRIAAALAVLGMLATSTAIGASFDCAKASTRIEAAICASPQVSKLDTELGALYRRLFDYYKGDSSVKDGQRNWIRNTRDKCIDEACLIGAYEVKVSGFRIALEKLGVNVDDIQDNVHLEQPAGQQIGLTSKKSLERTKASEAAGAGRDAELAGIAKAEPTKKPELSTAERVTERDDDPRFIQQPIPDYSMQEWAHLFRNTTTEELRLKTCYIIANGVTTNLQMLNGQHGGIRESQLPKQEFILARSAADLSHSIVGKQIAHFMYRTFIYQGRQKFLQQLRQGGSEKLTNVLFTLCTNADRM